MENRRLVGSSEIIRRLEDDLELAARSDAKVLITGESGVGKEIIAKLIHSRGARSKNPLVTINCAGIPDTLLASELFGHSRGSFTDAHKDKAGWLEQAHRGTIFLDEVGEMSLQMQALLLRFLENGEIQRVGSEQRGTRVDVRVIAATNRRLVDRVASKEFREDLFYRLNVIHLEIPPLRARREDVSVLLDYYFRRFAEAYGVDIPVMTDDAKMILDSYDWPGNVRELKNVVERLVVRWRTGPITPADLPAECLPRQILGDRAGATVHPAPSRAEMMFERIVAGSESFWTVAYEPFMSRDATRDDVRMLVRRGLEITRGNYKALVQLFNMPQDDYKRFLNFLRKYQSHLPIQEFRSLPVKVQEPMRWNRNLAPA
jgi:DNA-binding NtrC family response regulator